MPYHIYLHRSFDIQLSPVAASIIDWASSGRGGRLGADVSPGISSAGCKAAPQEGGRHTYRPECEQADELRWRARFPSTGSQCSIDSTTVRPLETIHKDGSPTPILSGDEPTKATKSNLGFPLRLGDQQMLVNSYAAIPLITCGSLSLKAGLFAALGMTGGVPPPALALSSSSSSSFSGGPRYFHASDVLQVECVWGRVQWTGVLNVFCFSWRSKALPLCEFIGITPTTDWSVQADRLLFNWSGFWRVFVRGNRGRFDSLISLDSSVKPFPFRVDADPPNSAECSSTRIRTGTPPTLVGGDGVGLSRVSASNGGGGGGGVDSGRELPLVMLTARDQSSGDKSFAGTSLEDPLPAGEDFNLRQLAGCPDDVALKRHAGRDGETPAAKGGVRRWWRLEELRCGLGFAVRNDLASGVNVYCGCSGHLGRALTISTHVDAIRRACCSVTCTTVFLDLAARLRMNLITWHRTELDAGVGWRPFKKAPGLTCRLSHSMGRTSIGLTVKDIVGQCNSLLRRDGEGGEDAAAAAAGTTTAGRREGFSVDQVASKTMKEPDAAVGCHAVGSLSWQKDSYMGWLKRAMDLLPGTTSISSSACPDPVKDVTASVPGLWERFSQAVQRMKSAYKASDLVVHQCDENRLDDFLLQDLHSSLYSAPNWVAVEGNSGETSDKREISLFRCPEQTVGSGGDAMDTEGVGRPVTQNNDKKSAHPNKRGNAPSNANVCERDYEYVLGVVNPRSGDNDAGRHVLHMMQMLLGYERVVTLDGSIFSNPAPLIEAIRCHAVRFVPHNGGVNTTKEVEKRGTIIVSGGDGTISFVMEQLDAVRNAIEMEMMHTDTEGGEGGNAVGAGNSTTVRRFVLPAVAVVALGTGNDFSNCMGFGSGYTRHKGGGLCCCMENPIEPLIHNAITAPAIPFDRWTARLAPLSVIREQQLQQQQEKQRKGEQREEEEEEEEERRPEVPSEKIPAAPVTMEVDQNLMLALRRIDWDALDAAGKCVKYSFINYFSVGFDAYVLQKFTAFRMKHPVFCGKRWRNKLVYGAYGIKAAFRCSALHDLIPAVCVPSHTNKVDCGADPSEESTDMKRSAMSALTLPKNSRALLVTNVDSYAAGTHPWKDNKGRLYRDTPEANPMIVTPVRVNDRKVEVQALGGLHQIGLLQLGIGNGASKLAQARELMIFFHCTPRDVVRPEKQQGNQMVEGEMGEPTLQTPLCVQVDGEPGSRILHPTVLHISEVQQPRVFVRCRNPKVVWTTSLGEGGGRES